MYFLISPDQFKYEHVYYSDATKNNIDPNSLFYRIIYSDNLCKMNGIYIDLYKFGLTYKMENLSNYIFSISDELIDYTRKIEMLVLQKLGIPTGQCKYQIKEKMGSMCVYGPTMLCGVHQPLSKYTEGKIRLILKITGVWEFNGIFGINYKFIFHRK